jgi:hypothetical protein
MSHCNQGLLRHLLDLGCVGSSSSFIRQSTPSIFLTSDQACRSRMKSLMMSFVLATLIPSGRWLLCGRALSAAMAERIDGRTRIRNPCAPAMRSAETTKALISSWRSRLKAAARPRTREHHSAALLSPSHAPHRKNRGERGPNEARVKSGTEFTLGAANASR